jgi:hypothetical protein
MTLSLLSIISNVQEIMRMKERLCEPIRIVPEKKVE